MTADRHQFSKGHQLIALAGWLLLSFAAAVSGAFITDSDWYTALRKPAWSPPGSLFGPVWTALYAMMGTAAWLVWREGGWRVQSKPLTLFLIQWVLNALWTPLFFGMRRPGLAFFEIIGLWIAILLTIISFWHVRRLAAELMMPYLAWVSFAAVLNFTLWRMNL